MKPVAPETIVRVALTVEQIDTVFDALEQLPYNQVVQLIDGIRNQVMPQLQQPELQSNPRSNP